MFVGELIDLLCIIEVRRAVRFISDRVDSKVEREKQTDDRSRTVDCFLLTNTKKKCIIKKLIYLLIRKYEQ